MIQKELTALEKAMADVEETKRQGDLSENSAYAESQAKLELKTLQEAIILKELAYKKELKVQWKPPVSVGNKIVMGTIVNTPEFGKIMILPFWEYSKYEDMLSNSGIIAVPSNAPVAINLLGKEVPVGMSQEVYK